MTATDQFVFIHLERTAGNFFATFLKRFFPSSQSVGYHYPRKMLPKHYQDRPIIGFVRNPWDWYVSFFFHKAFIQVPGVSLIGFEDLTRGLLFLNRNETYFQGFKKAFLDLCPISIEGNRSMGVTKRELQDFKSPDMGFYSWLFQRMFSDKDGHFSDVHFGRFEDLYDEIPRLFELCEVSFTQDMEEYLKQATDRPKATVHSPYHTYFNKYLRQGVEKQEKLIVDRFGYTF